MINITHLFLASALFVSYKSAIALSEHAEQALIVFNSGKYQSALDIALSLSKSSNPDGDYILGYMAEHGDNNHERDVELAAKYYSLASDKGHPEAKVALANIYKQWWVESRPYPQNASLDYIKGLNDNVYIKQSRHLYIEAKEEGHQNAGGMAEELAREVASYMLLVRSHIGNDKRLNSSLKRITTSDILHEERETEKSSRADASSSEFKDITNFSLIPGRARIWAPGKMTKRTMAMGNGTVVAYSYEDDTTISTFQATVVDYNDRKMASTRREDALISLNAHHLRRFTTMANGYKQIFGADTGYVYTYKNETEKYGCVAIDYSVTFQGEYGAGYLNGYSVFLPEGKIISIFTQIYDGESSLDEETHYKYVNSLDIL